jgi:GTP-binding protein HflX
LKPRRASGKPARGDFAGSPARALVVVPILSRSKAGEGRRTPEARLEEAVGLARAINLDVAGSGVVPLSEIKPATYLTKGKVEDVAALVRTEDAGLVFVDTALSPVQQRNLEKAWNAKVVDRTGLILEIFGERARTREGALQVELAHLNYQKSRLVRSWTHLERQRGGFGFLGGPGETQLEADRRQLEERIKRIEGALDAGEGEAHARAASREPAPRPVPHRGPGWLHQCRQVHAVQSADPSLGSG